MVTAVCQNPLLALAGSGMAAHPTVKVILGVPEDRDATTKVFGAFKGGTCLKVQNILLTKETLRTFRGAPVKCNILYTMHNDEHHNGFFSNLLYMLHSNSYPVVTYLLKIHHKL